MKIKIRIAAALTFAALTLGLFSSSPSVSASRGCQKVKGNLSVVNNGNGTESGTITQSGRLDGTTLTIFTSNFTPTPDPNAFSLTDDLIVTTNNGVLVTHNVAVVDVASFVFTAVNRLDPSAGTGVFAGATGVIYLNGSSPDGGATGQAEITGEICYADQNRFSTKN
jgi:hypothetical protein